MNTITRRATFAAALLAFTSAVAHAVPIDGEILNDDQDGLFSFYQSPMPGALPFFFDAGEDFAFDYDFASQTVGLNEQQGFLLNNADGDSALLVILDLFIDTNDADGFLTGSMLVSFDSEAPVTINFANTNIDGTPFNSTMIQNGVFSAFLSGAALDGPQLNFAFSGQIGPIGVAEPGVLALLALGGLAFGFSRRR